MLLLRAPERSESTVRERTRCVLAVARVRRLAVCVAKQMLLSTSATAREREEKVLRRFRDRAEAGQILAESLSHYADRDDVVVLALPRGGVPVAYELAQALHTPLDVLVVRKLGVPGREELAVGAIASGGIRIVDPEVARAFDLTEHDIATIAAAEQEELERREHQYRGDRALPDIQGKTVILVDDGLATGSTVPVAARESCIAMREVADDVVCATTPEPFHAVGLWYRNFEQTTDEDVRELLADAERRLSAPKRSSTSGHEDVIDEREVTIHDERAVLTGALSIPADARGVVVFAHGSGSSRHSPRNQRVARELQRAGFATLLMDLLSAEEERQDARSRAFRFDIGLLARRLIGAVEWLGELPETRGLPIGLFGASTGAAAALIAAAARSSDVLAVVSRGGRPDLAGSALAVVRAPTLLIVGGDDEVVIELNQQAMREMRAPVTLEIVPGASHLFEEPGALERVAQVASDWFSRHLAATRLDRSASTEERRDIDARW